MDLVMNGKFTWILDNGHGIDTPGKRSLPLSNGKQFFEYRFNRDVVDYMMLLLDASGYDAVRLVPEEHDVPLSMRVSRANSIALSRLCILVSVHSNAYGNGNRFTVPRGIETYYFESSDEGEMLAEVFQENLVQTTGWRDRGVRAERFYILKHAVMPSVLTETGFYSNREQLEYLLDSDWRIRIAEAHVEAICEIEQMGPGFFQMEGGRVA